MTLSDTLEVSQIFLSKADCNGGQGDIRGPRPTEKQIATIVATVTPEPIVSIKSFLQGTFHFVLRIDTIYQRLILRTCALRSYPADRFSVEQHIREIFSKYDVASPYIFSINTTGVTAPFAYSLTAAAAGASLFYEQDKKRQRTYIGLLGEYIGRIHEINMQGFGPLVILKSDKHKQVVGVHKRWETFLTLRLQEHVDFLVKRGIVDAQQAKEILRIFQNLPQLLTSPVLLHGDVAHHNVFVDGTRVTLIDWEDCLSGDPVYDIAYYATGCFGHEDWLDAFLVGYKRVRSFSKDYERRFWLYFLRIALAKTVGRFRFAPTTKRTSKELSDRIQFAIFKLARI